MRQRHVQLNCFVSYVTYPVRLVRVGLYRVYRSVSEIFISRIISTLLDCGSMPLMRHESHDLYRDRSVLPPARRGESVPAAPFFDHHHRSWLPRRLRRGARQCQTSLVSPWSIQCRIYPISYRGLIYPQVSASTSRNTVTCPPKSSLSTRTRPMLSSSAADPVHRRKRKLLNMTVRSSDVR